jgi:hypothetical protein
MRSLHHPAPLLDDLTMLDDLETPFTRSLSVTERYQREVYYMHISKEPCTYLLYLCAITDRLDAI